MTSLGADLRAFIDASPSPFHAVAEMVRRLSEGGFTELQLQMQQRASLFSFFAPPFNPAFCLHSTQEHDPNGLADPMEACMHGYQSATNMTACAST